MTQKTMIKTIKKRSCINCGKEFVKKTNCSNKDWDRKHRFCSISCSKVGNKNRLGISYPAWNKGLLSPFVGELSHSWKGEEVSYSGIHHWVKKWKGSPKICEKCGNNKLRSRQYQWANIDHKYRRVLDDYIRLCAKCHADYDRKLRQK